MTLKRKKLFLLDLDGTIYIDGILIPGALDFLNKIRTQNAHYVFLTNNSSKSTNEYLARMQKLNIPCEGENIYSSTNYTVRYLKTKEMQSLYVVGTEALKEELKTEGFNILPEEDQTSHCDAVLVGFDIELNYKKIRAACEHLFKGVPFIATNPDMNCPMPGKKSIPDCGAICELLKAATKRSALFLGKPNPDMIKSLLEDRGISPADAVMVGDRLYTDIAIGLNSGIDAIAVLTGEMTSEDIEKSPIKPTYIFPSVREIL